MLTVKYFIAALILLSLAYLVFRVFVRRDYSRTGKLSFTSAVLETLMFALHANFMYVYIPVKWPKFPSLPENEILKILMIILIITGLLIIAIAMTKLGGKRLFGLPGSGLEIKGLYKFVRNPQLLGYGIVLLGLALMFPNLYSLSWLLMYCIIAHMMVKTEEEYLTKLFGDEYLEYCKTVPRYFPFVK